MESSSSDLVLLQQIGQKLLGWGQTLRDPLMQSACSVANNIVTVRTLHINVYCKYTQHTVCMGVIVGVCARHLV